MLDLGAQALNCSVTYSGSLALMLSAPPPDIQDWDIPGGHFYLQANGFGAAGGLGYAVVDDAEAAFWTEFERLGGLQRVGYPITSRFRHNGFQTQAFQKMALQWRADLNGRFPSTSTMT
jgi:hypothetical protein